MQSVGITISIFCIAVTVEVSAPRTLIVMYESPSSPPLRTVNTGSKGVVGDGSSTGPINSLIFTNHELMLSFVIVLLNTALLLRLILIVVPLPLAISIYFTPSIGLLSVPSYSESSSAVITLVVW